MAVMKKKGSKGLPPISTASLPDVIFMILFFFMVSTTMRDQELLVRYKLPEATEVQKLEKKSLVSFIHIGPPAMNRAAHPVERLLQIDPGHPGLRCRRARQTLRSRPRFDDDLPQGRRSYENGYRDRRQAGAASRQRPETLLCGFQVAGLLIRRFLFEKEQAYSLLFLFDRECRECAANTRQIRRKHRKRQREEGRGVRKGVPTDQSRG